METTDGKIEEPTSLLARIFSSAAARDGTLVLLAQGLGTAIALITDSLLFKRMATSERGFYSAGLAFQAVLLIIADLGISLSTVRVGAEYVSKGLVKEANFVFRRALITRLILAFGIAALAFFFSKAFVQWPLNAGNRTALVWAAAAAIVGTSMVAWGVDVSQSRRKFGVYLAQQLAASVLRGWILITMITRLGSADPDIPGSANAEMLLWGVAAAACLAGILSVVMQREVLQDPHLSDEAEAGVNAQLSRFGAYAAATVVLAGIGGYVEMLMIPKLIGPDDTAIYDGARRLAMMLPLIATATTTVLLPRAAALNSVEACRTYVEKSFRVSLPLAFASAGGLAVLASVFVPLFWGDKYQASIPALRWLCLGFGFNVLLNPISLVLYPLRRENTLLWLNALSILLSVGLGFALIPAYGPVGAAWSVAGVKIIIMLGCGAAVMWALKNPHPQAFAQESEKSSS